MFTIFSPELSVRLSEAIKKGDVKTLDRALDDAGGDPSGLLYARSRKTAWPLIRRVLEAPFKPSRLKVQLEMARYLLSRGADTKLSAPWGQSIIGSLSDNLRRHAQWEDRLVLLRFIAQLADAWSLDLSIRSKSEYTDLDYLFSHTSWEFSHGAGELMAKATLEAAKVMIELGAPMTRQEEYANYTLQVDRGHVRLTRAEASLIEEVAAGANHRREPLRAFDDATPLGDEVMTGALRIAWEEPGHPCHRALRAVGVLRDRAFRHHGWGWGPAEAESVELLTGVLDAMTNKEERRSMKSCITKLSKVHKPVFDELLYARAARLVIETQLSP